MKQSINLYQFRDAFERIRPNNFSYEGLEMLFNYLEDMEEDMGEDIEFDVIALCCDYSEESWQDIARNYSIDLNEASPEDDDYEEQCRQIVFDYLSDNTSVCGDTADGFVYQAF